LLPSITRETDKGLSFVGGINMASLQHSEMVSVIQRNSGQMQALLAVLREKNASNGILR
jgi:hypothetical protein